MASCNVLLDTGSSLALTRRSLADYLDLPGKPTTLDLSVAGGQSLGQTKERFVHFRLMNLQKTFASNVIVGVTCKCPGEPYPPTRLDPKNYDYLSGFDFSYSYPQSRPVPIDLILTSSIVYEMQDGEITQSPFEIGPRAAHYRLGHLSWTVRWLPLKVGQPGRWCQCIVVNLHQIFMRRSKLLLQHGVGHFDDGNFLGERVLM